jgi:hypothetical protein
MEQIAEDSPKQNTADERNDHILSMNAAVRMNVVM